MRDRAAVRGARRPQPGRNRLKQVVPVIEEGEIMIVANRKPFEEIVELVKPYKSILLLGCNECVTVCATGGAKEVAVLASELRMHREKEGQPIEIKEHVLERNCDPEYVESLATVIGDAEAVLSMACGCGIQFVGEHYLACAYCRRSTRPLTGWPRSRESGRSVVSAAATASSTKHSASVPSPAAQRVSLTAPAAVPTEGSAR